MELIVVVTVCFQGVESHESSKANADETSNVIEPQTSEGQEPETSSVQDETGPNSFEVLEKPQEQQETEEHMDMSDDTVVVTHDDVPSKTYLFHSKEALSLHGKQCQQIFQKHHLKCFFFPLSFQW